MNEIEKLKQFIKEHFPELEFCQYHEDRLYWVLKIEYKWVSNLEEASDRWQIIKIDLDELKLYISSDFNVEGDLISLVEDTWNDTPCYSLKNKANIKKIHRIIDHLRLVYRGWLENCKLERIKADFV